MNIRYDIAVSFLYGEHVGAFSFRSVFPPCDHGLAFDISLCENQSINQSVYSYTAINILAASAVTTKYLYLVLF